MNIEEEIKYEQLYDLKKALAKGREHQYELDNFFKRSIDILAAVLVDMAESTSKVSEEQHETYKLMTKELQNETKKEQG